MRLLTRTSRYFLLFSVSILALGSVLIVLALDAVLTHQLDESLARSREVLRQELVTRDSLPSQLKIMDKIIDFIPVSPDAEYAFYSDTILLVNDIEDEELEIEPFRKYIYTEQINDLNYRVELHQAKFEQEDLVLAMFFLILGFLVAFLLLVNLFNRYLSKRLWQPFYQIINGIQAFRITDRKGMELVASDIDEFALLSQSTADMTTKLAKDYQSLKRFSENASHELQTPLAIILAQTDLLLQKPDLDEASAQHLAAIQQASQRLTRLHRSLLLLTKIENRQFTETGSNRLDVMIEEEMETFAPLVAHKALRATLELSETTIEGNTDLLAILLQNLISNAIKYNYEEGELAIRLDDQKLMIQNTSHLPEVTNPEILFDRFYSYKGGQNTSSLGLGLAIVNEICDLYHWKIHYQSTGQLHTVTIQFS